MGKRVGSRERARARRDEWQAMDERRRRRLTSMVDARNPAASVPEKHRGRIAEGYAKPMLRLLAEHPECDLCGDEWSHVERRRLHCSRCDYSVLPRPGSI